MKRVSPTERIRAEIDELFSSERDLADDLRRLELLVKALGRHRREIQYSLAECLEDYHWDAAEQAGRPLPLDVVGDSLVAQEFTHARAVLDSLCGATTCRARGCSEQAPRHWGLCPHHDLELALQLDAE